MLTLIALTAALMQQPPAPPASPEGQGRVVFVGTDRPGGLDKDGDGQVSREEFAAPMNDHFARIDKDSNGLLSTEELTSGHGAMVSGVEGTDVRIVRVPAGHAGHRASVMPRIEMRRSQDGGEASGRVERVDSQTRVVVGEPGADGRREVVVHGGPEGVGGWTGSLRPDGPTGRIEFRHGDGPGGERHVVIHGGLDGSASFTGALAEGGPGGTVEMVRVGGPGGENGLDTDKDGKISEAEFTNPMREAFTRIDADRSGFIEAGERGQGHDVQVFTHRIEARQESED